MVGDAGRLPFPDATFDGVFCSNLLEHARDTGAVLADLADLGIAIDPERNEALTSGERAIHAASSKVAVWVIPTNEELIVARQTRDLLAAGCRTPNGKGA